MMPLVLLHAARDVLHCARWTETINLTTRVDLKSVVCHHMR